ncbi:MAG TPA: sigma-70 family RNA polymerase sigma factor, partial [Abditibacteriaceae bacterium]
EQDEVADEAIKTHQADTPGTPATEALDLLVQRAQNGDTTATEELMAQFRPLMRSRMHGLWASLQENLSGAEWADVESQVQLLFLSRLQKFRTAEGVYFSHYIAKMLDFDCRAWMREQRRGQAMPFSQMVQSYDEQGEAFDWLGDDNTQTVDTTADLEQLLSLREALGVLTSHQHQVIWSCCIEGKTELEVAQQLGLTRSAVRNRLAGALNRLRDFFAEREDSMYYGQSETPTRTGRALPQSITDKRQFWNRRINMSKDEKRPDLVGIGAGRPVLLQGVYDFEATGLKNPELLSPKLSYTVPPGRVLGIRFFRAGVSCDKMVCLSTVVNGDPHRLVPVAANSSLHVPFAIVEPIIAGSQIEIHIASDAPGTAIIDVGFLEMPA